ncbi:MAG: hypothetical protein GY716_24660 [bacterium]|nr:hypothetical protein [bacterium]
MVQQGRPLAEVRVILDHATIQTTLRYAHLLPEHLRDSMAALDAVMLSDSEVDTQMDTSTKQDTVSTKPTSQTAPTKALPKAGG